MNEVLEGQISGVLHGCNLFSNRSLSGYECIMSCMPLVLITRTHRGWWWVIPTPWKRTSTGKSGSNSTRRWPQAGQVTLRIPEVGRPSRGTPKLLWSLVGQPSWATGAHHLRAATQLLFADCVGVSSYWCTYSDFSCNIADRQLAGVFLKHFFTFSSMNR